METNRDAKLFVMDTTPRRDMAFAQAVLKRWIEDNYGSPYGLAEDHPKLRPATTYAILNGSKGYTPESKPVRRLEAGLGFPSGTVALLAVQDFSAMSDIDCPTDLIRTAKSLAPQQIERRTRNRGA